MSEVAPYSSDASWNVDTLKRHMDALFVARDRATDIAFASQEKLVSGMLESAKEAVSKAETSVDKRLEAMNEFRAALSDQQKTYATHADVNNIKERLDRIEKTMATGVDRSEAGSDNHDRLTQWIPIIVAFAALAFAMFNTGRIIGGP